MVNRGLQLFHVTFVLRAEHGAQESLNHKLLSIDLRVLAVYSCHGMYEYSDPIPFAGKLQTGQWPLMWPHSDCGWVQSWGCGAVERETFPIFPGPIPWSPCRTP